MPRPEGASTHAQRPDRFRTIVAVASRKRRAVRRRRRPLRSPSSVDPRRPPTKPRFRLHRSSATSPCRVPVHSCRAQHGRDARDRNRRSARLRETKRFPRHRAEVGLKRPNDFACRRGGRRKTRLLQRPASASDLTRRLSLTDDCSNSQVTPAIHARRSISNWRSSPQFGVEPLSSIQCERIERARDVQYRALGADQRQRQRQIWASDLVVWHMRSAGRGVLTANKTG